jgi:hypothetical protein
MGTLGAIARIIAVGLLLAILFYFVPKAKARLRAKAPPRFTLLGFWFYNFGWIMEPAGIIFAAWILLAIALSWFVALSSQCPLPSDAPDLIARMCRLGFS